MVLHRRDSPVAIFQLLTDGSIALRPSLAGAIPAFPSRALLGPLLYAGIVAFGITMLFVIGANEIAWASIFIYLPFVGADSAASSHEPESYGDEAAIARHLADFP